MTTSNAPCHRDIRAAVRDLCSLFPDEYHRKIDEQRAHPEAFVDALTFGRPTGPNQGVQFPVAVAEHLLGLPRSF